MSLFHREQEGVEALVKGGGKREGVSCQPGTFVEAQDGEGGLPAPMQVQEKVAGKRAALKGG